MPKFSPNIPQVSAHAVRILVLLLISIIIMLSVYAVATDYFYFSDPAFFFFAISTDLAPEAVWRQFPQRIVALVLSQGPSWLSLRAGFDLSVARQIYASTFFGLPILAIVFAWILNPAIDAIKGSSLIGCVLIFASFGFATEATVALSIFLVLFMAITTSKPSFLRRLALIIFPPMFFLTHEIALIIAPGLVFVAYREHVRGRLERKFWLVFLMGMLFSLSVWLMIHFCVLPTNPWVIKALQINSTAIFEFRYTILRPVAGIALVSVTGFFLLNWFQVGTPRDRALIVLSLLLIVYGFSALWRDIANDRYSVRAVMIWLAPILAFLPIRKQADTSHGFFVLALSCLILGAIHMKSIYDWTSYRDNLIAHVQGRSLSVEMSKTRAKELAKRFSWGWVLPFQAAILTERGSRTNLLLDESNVYAPLTCEMVHSADIQMQTLFTSEELERLKRYICERSLRE